jgi:hypothetical protein
MEGTAERAVVNGVRGPRMGAEDREQQPRICAETADTVNSNSKQQPRMTRMTRKDADRSRRGERVARQGRE